MYQYNFPFFFFLFIFLSFHFFFPRKMNKPVIKQEAAGFSQAKILKQPEKWAQTSTKKIAFLTHCPPLGRKWLLLCLSK